MSDQKLRNVIAVAGSQMTVRLENDPLNDDVIRIGAMVKVRSAEHLVVGTIAAAQFESGLPPWRALVVDLLGEITPAAGDRRKFSRGVSRSPALGAQVLAITAADRATVYATPSRSNIRIGTLHDDSTQPAFVVVDDLLAKHFAVLGSTGSGKSCTVTVILSGILADNPNAHIILIDPHNEYSTAFGKLADVVNVDNLLLPFWLFDFEELVRILIRGGTAQEQESQAIILKDVVTRARRHYAGDVGAAALITVDTPVPFRVADLLRFLNEGMGKLDKPDTAMPYLRLRTRIESLRGDRRLAFMFSDWFETHDTLRQVIGRLLSIPVKGSPLTIMDLSGVPSEIADVVVSLSCRILFDFALWSEREQMPPILLVCEEAHRYVPVDAEAGFAAGARAVTRIAKEGRKYNLSLALISQRPSELSPEALSQCGTVFSLRLGNDLDQRFMAKTLPNAAGGMLAGLAGLPTQQAIVSGEGVPLPMRIRFDDLPADRRPRSHAAEFSKAWQTDQADVKFCDEGIRRWRLQSRA